MVLCVVGRSSQLMNDQSERGKRKRVLKWGSQNTFSSSSFPLSPASGCSSVMMDGHSSKDHHLVLRALELTRTHQIEHLCVLFIRIQHFHVLSIRVQILQSPAHANPNDQKLPQRISKQIGTLAIIVNRF